jgi:TetR/AcrR family transcriptional regulator of autoinduction and epiphytic fitness
MPTEARPTEGVDGRSARASRTRHAVVAALLALLEDGDLRPTARRVAERAGVSLRSVYVHFDDLEDLFCSVAEQEFTKISALVHPLPTVGPVEVRIEAFVDQRVRVLETGAAVRRAAIVHAPFSPTLARVLEMARHAGRIEAERVFQTELDVRSPAEQRELLAALATIASGGTWDSLRRVEGLDVRAASDVLVRMLRAVLDHSESGRASPGPQQS